MKTEGDVSVVNAGGRNLSVIENMKLYNGYRTDTQESSYAWINLDSEKLTKLDAVSEAEIRKSGKQLEILLNSGNLFFDVTKPLEEEETLNIRTSTMVMGIRGTSGWVKILDKWRCQAYVLEGSVTCCVCDPVTGQIKRTILTGGEMAEFVVYEKDENGQRCDIIKRGFSEDEIDGFVLVELARDPDLCKKIKDASGLDAAGAAENAAQRLAGDEARMGEILAGIRGKYANQENNISKDPVWVHGGGSGGTGGEGGTAQGETPDGGTGSGGGTPGTGTAPAGVAGTTPSGGTGTAAAGGTGTTPSGGSGTTPAGSGTTPGGSTDTTPPPGQVTLTSDASVEEIQSQLSDPSVAEVVIEPSSSDDSGSTGDDDDPMQSVTVDSDLIIPSGKTLTTIGEVGMTVAPGTTVTVEGTLNVDGTLENNGIIIVEDGDYLPT